MDWCRTLDGMHDVHATGLACKARTKLVHCMAWLMGMSLALPARRGLVPRTRSCVCEGTPLTSLSGVGAHWGLWVMVCKCAHMRANMGVCRIVCMYVHMGVRRAVCMGCVRPLAFMGANYVSAPRPRHTCRLAIRLSWPSTGCVKA